MADDSASWESTDDGLVVFVDALATRGILASRGASQIFATWASIANDVLRLCDEVASYREYCRSCVPIIVSDTIIISIMPSDKEHLRWSVTSMGRLLQILVFRALQQGVFLRGAVSAGSFHQRNSHLVGPAVDEAASWFETSNWIGVNTTPSLSLLLDNYAAENYEVRAFYRKYRIPRGDTASDMLWAVDWPRYAATADGKDALLLEVRQHFYEAGGAITPAIVSKYVNTLRFIEDLPDE